MKKSYIFLFILCFFTVSCTKNMKDILKMPNSHLASSKNYNTAIKADEFSSSFYKACAYGKVSEIERFIKKGKSINALDAEGYSPLFYAVLGGNPSAYAESLTKFKTAIINDNDAELYEALDCVPAVKSNTKVVSYLLKNGANVQLKDKQEYPVFIYAALFANDVSVLSELKNAGANINDTITIHHPSSILSIACMTNPNTEIIDFLCKQGNNINEQNKFGTSPIMWAAMYNSNPDVIDVLKNNGANINDKRHKDGYTPLIWSVRCNRNPAITERLCELGANINATDKYSWHALDWAMLDMTSFEFSEKLKNNNLDSISDFISTCKSLSSKGKNEHLKILLKYCNDDKLKQNALFTACLSSYENFSDLLSSISDFNAEEVYKPRDVISMITAIDDADKLKLLNSNIEKFFEENFERQVICMVIFKACKIGEYLFSSLDSMSFDVQSYILTECKDKDILHSFLNTQFIDVHKKDEYGKTLLYIACENNNYEVAKMLIEKGSDVNTTCSSQKSRTPLLAQCYKTYPSKDIVNLLVNNGARVNAKDEDGVSPLIAACYSNYNDSAIKILLNNGANKVEKYKNSYPYEYCNTSIKNNYYSTYKILYDSAPHSWW